MEFRTAKIALVLLRLITLEGMLHNVRIFSKHVKTEENVLADALSRGQMSRFWENAPISMNRTPVAISDKLWPVQNIWMK